MTPVALTIAGSDPSGGAGIQADLKTFHQRGVYGMSVLTMLTVQNTQRVDALHCLPADFVIGQLDAVLADISPNAAKTGAGGRIGYARGSSRTVKCRSTDACSTIRYPGNSERPAYTARMTSAR